MNIPMVLATIVVAVGTMILCCRLDRWESLQTVLDKLREEHPDTGNDTGKNGGWVKQLQDEPMSQIDICHLRDVRFRELNEKRRTPRPEWMNNEL